MHCDNEGDQQWPYTNRHDDYLGTHWVGGKANYFKRSNRITCGQFVNALQISSNCSPPICRVLGFYDRIPTPVQMWGG